MIDKIVRCVAEALEGLKDGATIMIGGFGEVGQPDALVEGVIARGTEELTLVSNNAGFRGLGVAKLIDLGRVRKIICSFPRAESESPFERFYRSGRIELEIVPQGTLAERIRAGGAGIPAFYTPTGAGTLVSDTKEVRLFDNRPHVLEMALRADVALIEAWESDRWGNCTYRESGRNYNPIMAAAAALTIVQTQHLRALGEIPPDHVMTPGIYVQRVVQIDRGSPWTG